MKDDLNMLLADVVLRASKSFIFLYFVWTWNVSV